MNKNKIKHKILEVLFSKTEKNKGKVSNSHLILLSEISEELKISIENLSILVSELEFNKNVKKSICGDEDGSISIEDDGKNALFTKKYIRKNKKETKKLALFWSGIVIPVLSLLIALLSLSIKAKESPDKEQIRILIKEELSERHNKSYKSSISTNLQNKTESQIKPFEHAHNQLTVDTTLLNTSP